MHEDVKKLCACPSCHCTFWISETREAKTVSCKKCDSKFQITFDATLNLAVSQDSLKVYIHPKGKIPAEGSVATVKKLLEAKGIKYGLVDDTVIANYMKDKNLQGKPLEIAQGKAPEATRDATVKYYFDTDPNKIGKIKEGGAIDFKDRGEIPQVKDGDLIAEKILGRAGSPGIDVFGNPIPVEKPKDIKIRCGKGAELSKDMVKIVATIDGLPHVPSDGRIFVSPELKMSGDVGLETGHVDFDGDIAVSGSVQNGFHVKGKRLTAGEILKARIHITGDVVVFGGIIGAHIKADGNVRARHVRGSTIQALGDVVIETECFDSTIVSSGACIVKGGRICSSSILAKSGIEAKDIGSDSSAPCNLVVGIDVRVKKKIERLKKQIMLRKKVQGNRKERIKQLHEDSKKAEKAVGKIAQAQDQLMVKQRALKERAELFEKAENREQLTNVEMLAKNLDSKIRKAEQALEKLFSAQDGIASKMAVLEKRIENGKKRTEELFDEVEALTEWSAKGKPMPTVKVYATIYSGTVIRGIYSSIVIRENYINSLIREAKMSEPDSRRRWKMLLTSLT